MHWIRSLLFLLMSTLFLLPGMVSGAGTPFTGNHSFDQLQVMKAEISDTSGYLEDYLQGMNQTPSDPKRSLYLGKVSLKADNASEAERQFTYVLSKDNKSKDAWSGLLLSLTLQKKDDELLNQSVLRLKDAPYDELVWLDKAWAEMKRNHLTDSLASLHKVLALNPKNIYGHYYAAWNYDGLGQRQNALKEYEKVNLMAPEYGGVNGNIAFAYVGKNEYDKALPYLEKALAWYPDWVEARRTRAMVLYHLDKKDEAIQALDEAIRLQPEYVMNYLSKAEAQKDMKQFNDALDTVNTGLPFDSNNTGLLIMKGDILLDMNQFEDAQSVYQNITTIAESDKESYLWEYINALWGTGYALENLGRDDEAISAYKQALKELDQILKDHPSSGSAMHLKGKILEGLGEYQMADITEERALEFEYSKFAYL